MIAAYVLKTHASKTDANLLLKMIHDTSFDPEALRSKNVDTLYKVVDTLIEMVPAYVKHDIAYVNRVLSCP